jgi:5-methylcytosine-specific restriction enzyme A
MPRSAPTPCRYPGCAAVVATPGFCEAHRPLIHRDYGRARRGFDAEVGFYQSRQWRSVRAAFLREHPLCGACGAKGLLLPARVVDHVQPIKDGGARFDEPTCSRCACPVTTARPHASQRRGQVPPGGDESLRLASRDACACPNFFACKLN